MDNKEDLYKIIKDLCYRQMHYVCDFPKRENIPVYDRDLDLEMNEDFALWEMEWYL